MTKQLLYKEIKLSIHPTCYIFLLLSSMLLIPSYPFYVSFFYQTLGIFFLFFNGNVTQDITFTSLLPIRKKAVVKARFLTVILIELAQIAVTIPFALLRDLIYTLPNQAGIEANVAFFGLVFVMFGIFNATFIPGFYKTAVKTGIPFILACSAMLAFVAASEAAIQLNPSLDRMLDTVDPRYVPQQTAVLILGIAIFALATFLAYEKSARRFELLDL